MLQSIELKSIDVHQRISHVDIRKMFAGGKLIAYIIEQLTHEHRKITASCYSQQYIDIEEVLARYIFNISKNDISFKWDIIDADYPLMCSIEFNDTVAHLYISYHGYGYYLLNEKCVNFIVLKK